METKLLHAYINALFWMVDNPRKTSFFSEACSLKHEILDPHASAREVFEAIDRNPIDAFESHLRTTARKAARN